MREQNDKLRTDRRQAVKQALEQIERGEAKALGISYSEYLKMKKEVLDEIDRLSRLKIVETPAGERARSRKSCVIAALRHNGAAKAWRKSQLQ